MPIKCEKEKYKRLNRLMSSQHIWFSMVLIAKYFCMLEEMNEMSEKVVRRKENKVRTWKRSSQEIASFVTEKKAQTNPKT